MAFEKTLHSTPNPTAAFPGSRAAHPAGRVMRARDTDEALKSSPRRPAQRRQGRAGVTSDPGQMTQSVGRTGPDRTAERWGFKLHISQGQGRRILFSCAGFNPSYLVHSVDGKLGEIQIKRRILQEFNGIFSDFFASRPLNLASSPQHFWGNCIPGPGPSQKKHRTVFPPLLLPLFQSSAEQTEAELGSELGSNG